MIDNETSTGSNQAENAVELRGVIKRFGRVTAVNNVDLIIEKGEIFSLLGPSGCGKTTLLRMIAGFEKPDHGEIIIQGEVVNRIPPYKRECNLVFQQMALFPHMNVAENVAFGLKERKRPPEEIRERVRSILEVVSLSGFDQRMPHQLSGGQKQRVALARSLVLKPKVLLLDEPLAALDRKLRKEMQVELRRIQREVGITFLYVTHDQKVALSLSDRMGIMCEGRVMQIGAPMEIYEKPRTHFVATFIGACNIFPGNIIGRNGNGLEIRNEDGLRFFASSCSVAEDANIYGLSVHPEIIQVYPEDADSERPLNLTNIAAGQIVEVLYQGDFTELNIKIEQNGQVITAHVRRGAEPVVPFKADQKVTVAWDPCHCNILREYDVS